MWYEGNRVDAVVMKCYFDISIQRILRECITQTSLDVQAMRSTGGDNVALADSIYDDWTINEDNKPELLTPLQDMSASLAKILRDKVCIYNCGMDIISWEIDVADATSTNISIMQNALLRYYKHSLLGWWYQLRNADLMTLNNALANDALGDIISSVGLNKSRLVGHYF